MTTSQLWNYIFTLIYGQYLSMVLIFILWRMYYVINDVISDNINKMQTTLTSMSARRELTVEQKKVVINLTKQKFSQKSVAGVLNVSMS